MPEVSKHFSEAHNLAHDVENSENGKGGEASESGSPNAQPAQAPKTVVPRPKFPLGIYKAGLFVATIFWGLSFVVLKSAVDAIPPAQVLSIRFLSCGIILALIFARRMRTNFNRGHILHGLVLGVLLGLAFWVQTLGLVDTTPGVNAFLTATYCVLVPFVWWLVARRRPTAFNIIAALACVAGVGFISLSGSAQAATPLALGKGEALTLLSAVFYAMHIVYVAKISPGKDIFVLTAYQFIAAGAFCLIIGATTEPSLANIVITSQLILEVAYLTLFASLFALLIQNVALQYVPPAQASLILSLESVFGMLFSIIFFGERITLPLVVGFGLIFAAVILSENGADLKEKLTARLKKRTIFAKENSSLCTQRKR